MDGSGVASAADADPLAKNSTSAPTMPLEAIVLKQHLKKNVMRSTRTNGRRKGSVPCRQVLPLARSRPSSELSQMFSTGCRSWFELNPHALGAPIGNVTRAGANAKPHL